MAPPLKMFGFWRSQATYRLRVALNLKGIPYDESPVDLDSDSPSRQALRKINPQDSVPTLLIETADGGQEVLSQSLAVMEYLEETHPTPPLLPADALGRARVRSLASIAVADAHPLIVPRVRGYLIEHAGFSPEQWKAWQTHWFSTALMAFEARLVDDGRTAAFCHGDAPTMADVCLAGLMQGAGAFGIEVKGIPTVERIVAKCAQLDAFEKARAVYQVDFPGGR